MTGLQFRRGAGWDKIIPFHYTKQLCDEELLSNLGDCTAGFANHNSPWSHMVSSLPAWGGGAEWEVDLPQVRKPVKLKTL